MRGTRRRGRRWRRRCGRQLIRVGRRCNGLVRRVVIVGVHLRGKAARCCCVRNVDPLVRVAGVVDALQLRVLGRATTIVRIVRRVRERRVAAATLKGDYFHGRDFVTVGVGCADAFLQARFYVARLQTGHHGLYDVARVIDGGVVEVKRLADGPNPICFGPKGCIRSGPRYGCRYAWHGVVVRQIGLHLVRLRVVREPITVSAPEIGGCGPPVPVADFVKRHRVRALPGLCVECARCCVIAHPQILTRRR